MKWGSSTAESQSTPNKQTNGERTEKKIEYRNICLSWLPWHAYNCKCPCFSCILFILYDILRHSFLYRVYFSNLNNMNTCTYLYAHMVLLHDEYPWCVWASERTNDQTNESREREWETETTTPKLSSFGKIYSNENDKNGRELFAIRGALFHFPFVRCVFRWHWWRARIHTHIL